MRRRPWFGLHPRATLCRLLLLLVLAWITRQRVWSLMLISGDSMLPTLHGGQIVGINKLAYCVRPPERGDIVAIWTGEELIVKRIVGLPGEEIALRDGTTSTAALCMSPTSNSINTGPSRQAKSAPVVSWWSETTAHTHWWRSLAESELWGDSSERGLNCRLRVEYAGAAHYC